MQNFSRTITVIKESKRNVPYQKVYCKVKCNYSMQLHQLNNDNIAIGAIYWQNFIEFSHRVGEHLCALECIFPFKSFIYCSFIFRIEKRKMEKFRKTTYFVHTRTSKRFEGNFIYQAIQTLRHPVYHANN